MKRVLYLFVAFGIVLIVVAPFATATPEYAKKESKGCLFCHTAMGKAELNDAGKYYRDNKHSLEGYGKKKP